MTIESGELNGTAVSPFNQDEAIPEDKPSEPQTVCATCILQEMDNYMESPGAILVNNVSSMTTGSVLIGEHV